MKKIERMLKDICVLTQATALETDRSELAPAVLGALNTVPRDAFVGSDLAASAFDNGPLPIGFEQTISQPFIVALMTDLLEIKSGDSILEIGTGSGYQCAVLAQLAANVYSVEKIAELSRLANARFNRLGYGNIHTKVGNGYQGWSEHAPYNGVMVTAAAPFVPPALIEQLAGGGRLVIPLGPPHGHQALFVIQKGADGTLSKREILDVAFVPLVD